MHVQQRQQARERERERERERCLYTRGWDAMRSVGQFRGSPEAASVLTATMLSFLSHLTPTTAGLMLGPLLGEPVGLS
jgi:hypothetical protein